MLAAFAAQAPERAEETAPEAPARNLRPLRRRRRALMTIPRRIPLPRRSLDATRRINLEDLKFGRNYKGEK